MSQDPRPTETAEPAAARDLQDPGLYINRELSWLAFNERVLVQARSATHPLLERVKFLAIAANNLDEFFMIRVATLTRQHRAGLKSPSPDGLSVAEQLTAARARAERMLRDIADCWHNELAPLLSASEIHFLEADRYTPAITKHLAEYFSVNVSPVLTPLA